MSGCVQLRNRHLTCSRSAATVRPRLRSVALLLLAACSPDAQKARDTTTSATTSTLSSGASGTSATSTGVGGATGSGPGTILTPPEAGPLDASTPIVDGSGLVNDARLVT